MWVDLTRYLMALIYVAAGLNHLRDPGFYMPMMPPYLPMPEVLNFAAGGAEILLGILLCFGSTQRLGAWGIVALLIAVFPANLYMYQTGGAGYHLPHWVLVARLPLQALLILWAWAYT